MEVFDLIHFQREAREIKKPKELFDLWEWVCVQYDRGRITRYDLDEMKAVIWPTLHDLDNIRQQVNQTFEKVS